MRWVCPRDRINENNNSITVNVHCVTPDILAQGGCVFDMKTVLIMYFENYPKFKFKRARTYYEKLHIFNIPQFYVLLSIII